MNISKLVTVIVPAYNHEDFILRSLQSVIIQTYENIELIVIDDGSKDNTYQKAIEFKNIHLDKNITLLTKKNEGVCRTLNKGIELAHGDYICFLASDDYWRKDKIEKQLTFMEMHTDVGLVFSDALFVYNNIESNDFWSEYKNGYQKYFNCGIQKKVLYTKLMKYLFIPSLTVMLRSHTLHSIGFFDTNLPYEDIDMWLRFALNSKIGYIDEPLAYYRMHSNNISNDSKIMLYGYYLTLRKHFKYPELKSHYLFKVLLVIAICWNLLKKRLIKAFLKNRR